MGKRLHASHLSSVDGISRLLVCVGEQWDDRQKKVANRYGSVKFLLEY